MSHFITIETAKTMTDLYRAQKENILDSQRRGQNILARSETFDRAAIDALLAVKDCQSIRVYYGMSTDFKVHAVVVPVDSAGKDILPESGTPAGEEDPIVEMGVRCPVDCPPPSDLNP